MSPHLVYAKPGEGIVASHASKPTYPTCSYCHGHLVADLYIDTVDAGGHVWIRALRCVRCGNIEAAGRTGLACQPHAGKGVWKREGPAQKGLDDEMIVLGT